MSVELRSWEQGDDLALLEVLPAPEADPVVALRALMGPDTDEPAWSRTVVAVDDDVDSYREEEAPNTKGGTDVRTVLGLDPRLAPVKAAVLPLSKKDDLKGVAGDLAAELRRRWNIDYDDAGAIGRRYRRQDEIGTPYCVTVDFDTLEDQAVTIRERDEMTQERVSLDKVSSYLADKLGC